MSVAKRVKRVLHQGCERPGSCQWFCIVHITAMAGDVGADYLALALCDFHTECRREGLRLSFEQQRAVTPREALRQHPAAWRALRC